MKICFWYNQVCFLRVFLKDVFAAYIKIPRSKWPASTSASLELTGTGGGETSGTIRGMPLLGMASPAVFLLGMATLEPLEPVGDKWEYAYDTLRCSVSTVYCTPQFFIPVCKAPVFGLSSWTGQTRHNTTYTHLSIHLVPLGGKIFTVQSVCW